jgi:hypothetical protein
MGNMTVHGVLAGAYRGKSAASYLTHASLGGHDSICKRVKPGMLCDVEEEGPPTCPVCAARMAKAATGR